MGDLLPAQETQIHIYEGMAHENRKAGQALLALAERQEAQAFDLKYGEGEAERIKENMEVWNGLQSNR